MESQVEVHPCAICGKDCVLTLVSIGTAHQWVAQVICPDCVTPEQLESGEWKMDSPFHLPPSAPGVEPAVTHHSEEEG